MIVYCRSIFDKLENRLAERRKYIQVLLGPRQVGKTTGVRQCISRLRSPTIFEAADEPELHDRFWLEQVWNKARAVAEKNREAVLVLDEIQKVENWSETVKRFWDEDAAKGLALKVVLLGSSTSLVRKGLADSLAGRFEIIPVPHWAYTEMRDAFNLTLDDYIFFGGYPGSLYLKAEFERWNSYVLNALIETTVSKDLLQANRIDKPILLKRLFQFACRYSSEILSFNKMLGQLHDAGNTTTLAQYLEYLSRAGLVTGLQKYSGNFVRQRSSSPKFLVFNTALISAIHGRPPAAVQDDPAAWGRRVESAVGAHLLNLSLGNAFELMYWREGNHEVDYVMVRGDDVVAIEVKSGGQERRHSGLRAFDLKFKPMRSIVVGPGGTMSLEECLLAKADDFWRQT